MFRLAITLLTFLVLTGCNMQEEFFAAIRARDVQQVKALCKLQPSVVRAEDQWGSIGLNIAVECGNVEIVRILVEAGSDLHHDSRVLGMPLQYAAHFGDKDIVELLLKAGAGVNRQPKHKWSHSKGTALHSAVLSRKRLEIVKILLEHGADVNAKKTYGDSTPLHRAAAADPTSPDAVKIVQILLDHGADVNAKEKYGRTPLYFAKRTPKAQEGHREIIDLLIKNGAKDESGKRASPGKPDNR